MPTAIIRNSPVMAQLSTASVLWRSSAIVGRDAETIVIEDENTTTDEMIVISSRRRERASAKTPSRTVGPAVTAIDPTHLTHARPDRAALHAGPLVATDGTSRVSRRWLGLLQDSHPSWMARGAVVSAAALPNTDPGGPSRPCSASVAR